MAAASVRGAASQRDSIRDPAAVSVRSTTESSVPLRRPSGPRNSSRFCTADGSIQSAWPGCSTWTRTTCWAAERWVSCRYERASAAACIESGSRRPKPSRVATPRWRCRNRCASAGPRGTRPSTCTAPLALRTASSNGVPSSTSASSSSRGRALCSSSRADSTLPGCSARSSPVAESRRATAARASSSATAQSQTGSRESSSSKKVPGVTSRTIARRTSCFPGPGSSIWSQSATLWPAATSRAMYPLEAWWGTPAMGMRSSPLARLVSVIPSSWAAIRASS